MKATFFLPLILLMCIVITASIEKKHPLLKVDALQDYVEIPAGEVQLASVTSHVQGFFIAKYEVSNRQYQEYLQALKEKGDLASLEAAQIKSDHWQKLNTAGNMEALYHTHSAFADFPVVNITLEGAQGYCQWLTEKVNQEAPSGYTVTFRLPSREEWIRAARGASNSSYAWESPYLMNSEGLFLCNFKKLGAEQIHYNQESNTYEIVHLYDGPDASLTDKVGNYAPNTFGLYDMSGNVAEMISNTGLAVGGSFDASGYDVRVESTQAFQEASPLVGFRPVMEIKE